jgi:hypothetical protein
VTVNLIGERWARRPLLLSFPMTGLLFGMIVAALLIVAVSVVTVIPTAVSAPGAGGEAAPVIVIFALLFGALCGAFTGLAAGFSAWLLLRVGLLTRHTGAAYAGIVTGAFLGSALAVLLVIAPISNWPALLLVGISGVLSSLWFCQLFRLRSAILRRQR